MRGNPQEELIPIVGEFQFVVQPKPTGERQQASEIVMIRLDPDCAVFTVDLELTFVCVGND